MLENHLPFSRADLRVALDRAYLTLRDTVHHIGASAKTAIGRVSDQVERYAGSKIERRVRPPITVALAVAGVALVIAIIAVARS